MIIEEIKKANIQAMKDHDANARAIYSVLMNKHLLLSVDKKTRGEETTDNDMISIIQKTIKEVAEEMEINEKANRQEEVDNLKSQIVLIEKFLPAQMSEEEIKAEILKLDDKSIPSVMKHFKQNFAGQCDMKLVQDVLKSLA